MGSSPLAFYFGYTLNLVFRHIVAFTEDGLELRRVVFEMGSKDLLVAFGFPRYPSSILRVLKIGANRGIPRLVFTDTQASPLVPLADRCVFMPFELMGFVNTLAAPISFLGGLAAEIVKLQPKGTSKRLENFERMAADFGIYQREF
jgi:DNA-binding MurR/RpiR family transcriptional regulator